ncbi:MAG: MBL fold metallo-hydrolase, partial [Anaerolineaceae bacterium]|nr:MBL fold metallo-hydrolase [Anaerolineaceae bacterium]
GASPAHAMQMRSALAELGGSPPQYAALTHWHWDHVFGTATLGLLTIAHSETRRRVLEMARLDWRDHAIDTRVAAGLEIPMIAHHVKIEMSNAQRAGLVILAPDLTFTDQVEVNLGGLTAEVRHVGGDHTPDSSIVYVPEERVAFLGDCFYNGFIGNDSFYTLWRLLPLLDTLEAIPAEYFVLAHDPEPLPRAQFLKEIAQLRRITDLVARIAEREAVLAQLPGLLNEPVNEDHVDAVDALLRGMRGDC